MDEVSDVSHKYPSKIMLNGHDTFKHFFLFVFFHDVLGFRINVPNIEDALQQIQGHLSSSSQNSSFLSSNSNLSR